jgi:DNA polymerase III epsilon subunit-like protein
MTDEVIKIHHITNEMSQASDTTIEDCLISFVDECKGVDLIVGHNIDFDNKMVLDELKRCEEENEKGDDDPATCLNLVVRNIFIREAMEEFARFNFYCTMRETIEFCNIEASFKTGKKYKKFPKLIELHDKLFGEGTNTLELHNSLNDVYVCFKCYFKLQGIDV